VISEEAAWGSRIEHFLSTREISPRSTIGYRRDLLGFQTWCEAEGLQTPEVVSASAMSRYYATYVAEYAQASVSRRFGVLRMFYQWLVSEGVCESSPLQSLKFNQPNPVVRDTLSI